MGMLVTQAKLGLKSLLLPGCNVIPTINFILSGRVVRKVDNAIHWINYYPADSVVCFVNTYPLDSDLSDG